MFTAKDMRKAFEAGAVWFGDTFAAKGRVAQTQWEAEALHRWPDEPEAAAPLREACERLAEEAWEKEGDDKGWVDAKELAALLSSPESWVRKNKYICINGHRMDHYNTDGEGHRMCAHPDCNAEAEIDTEPKAPGAKRWRCMRCGRTDGLGQIVTSEAGVSFHWDGGDRPWCGPIEEVRP
jgi:hypothetical protein